MARNKQIVTVSTPLSGVSSHVAIGSSVAAGMKRYVTFLRVQQVAKKLNEGSRVFFCSTAASNTASSTGAASTAQKLQVVLHSALISTHGGGADGKQATIPNVPNTDHPLFTIAESKWLSAYLCSVAGQSYPVYVFAQYYDQ